VESKKGDLRNFVLEVVSRVPNNYPRVKHQLRGLYRKVSTEGAKFTHVEEATVLIEDRGYKQPSSVARMAVEHFRESTDWGSGDSLYMAPLAAHGERLADRISRPANPLVRLYESNFIRGFAKGNNYFNFKSFRDLMDDHFAFESWTCPYRMVIRSTRLPSAKA
jgi:hypothetical protein